MVATPVEDLVESVRCAFEAEKSRGERIGWSTQSAESGARVDAAVRGAVTAAIKQPEAWQKYLHFGKDHYVSRSGWHAVATTAGRGLGRFGPVRGTAPAVAADTTPTPRWHMPLRPPLLPHTLQLRNLVYTNEDFELLVSGGQAPGRLPLGGLPPPTAGGGCCGWREQLLCRCIFLSAMGGLAPWIPPGLLRGKSLRLTLPLAPRHPLLVRCCAGARARGPASTTTAPATAGSPSCTGTWRRRGECAGHP